MKLKKLCASAILGLATIAGTGYIAYNSGLESGRQEGRQEVKMKVYNEGSILTRKCEDDMKYSLHAMNLDLISCQRKVELQQEFGYAQVKHDEIRNLIQEIERYEPRR